jgi:hypothetical protein
MDNGKGDIDHLAIVQVLEQPATGSDPFGRGNQWQALEPESSNSPSPTGTNRHS